MKVIALNGPPRSGKDTVASIMANRLGRDITRVMPLSMPMRAAVYGMLGLTYSDEHYEKFKDKTISIGGVGTSIRQLMIGLSERWVKPVFGDLAWVNLRVSEINEIERATDSTYERIYIIPDIGFQPEIDLLAYAFGPANVCLIRVQRPDYDFSNDSRSYVEPPAEVTAHILNNTGSLQDLRQSIHYIEQWQRAIGWFI